jgi:hypothetical protein
MPTQLQSLRTSGSARRLLAHLVGVMVLGGSISAGVAVATTQAAAAATDTVTNCSGDPTDAGSLPYEVQNAANGDTIDFALSPSCSLISLTGTIDISSDLTIAGPGSGALVVSGDGTVEVFDVVSGTVDISGLSIEDGMTPAGQVGSSVPQENGGNGGNGTDGGGIFNSGILTLSSDVVSGNSTGPGGAGGYGYAGPDSTGTGGDGGDGGDGGGIYNAGTLTLTDDAVSGNSTGAGGGGGAADLTGGDGGNSGNGAAIYSSGTLTLTNDAISGNSTGAGGSADSEGPEAQGGDGGNSGDGGAVFNSGALTLTGGSLADNGSGPGGSGGSAEGLGGNGGSSGDGGGIYNISPDTIALSGTTLSSDSTGAGGGAGLDNGGATGGNGGDGGGIYSSGTVTLETSTVADDSTGSGSSGDNSETVGDSGGNGGGGGGIYSSGTFVLTNDTLAGDESGSGANGDSGSGFSGGNGGNGGDGGGIYSSDYLLLQSVTVVGNGTGSGGTGAEGSDESGTSGSAGAGGGITAGSGSVVLTATIVAESPDGGACSGSVTDNGYNIDDDTTCGFGPPSINDSSTLDPKLGPLANNGGPTETIALLKKSPAIDQVPSEDCPLTDQRGASRTAPCDIGAYDTDGNPKIKSFAPTSGRVGKAVVIDGTNLAGVTSVLFNGTLATIIKNDTATSFKTKVPAGATTGKISVTTYAGGTAVSKTIFTVEPTT